MFELVSALWVYWDGPREGIADFQGQPHVFVSEWDEGIDDYGNAFLLKPLDPDTFRLAMEDWAILQRWKAAVTQGLTTFDTHPVSPEDRIRHEELKQQLQGPLAVNPGRTRQSYPTRVWKTVPLPPVANRGTVVRRAAEFRWEGTRLEVRWSAVS